MPDDGTGAFRFAPIAGRIPGALTAPDSPVKIVTYNIHTCVGVDRRYDPARTAAVLREIGPDIACLQEVDARRHLAQFDDQWAYLGEATGLTVVSGDDIREHRGRFANAILTRFPALAARSIDLSVAGYEPRSAIIADLLVGDRVLRVFATHFGLHAGERRFQASQLLAALGEASASERGAADAILVMGDLNEWRGRSGGIRLLDRRLGPSAVPRTFPSWMPVLPLDRIYADGRAMLRDLHVYRSPLARLASDHLPLVGTLSWTGQRRPSSPRRRGARASRRERVAITGSAD